MPRTAPLPRCCWTDIRAEHQPAGRTRSPRRGSTSAACDGVSHVVRRGTGGQHKADQRHNEEQLEPEDGNEGEDDSCDNHRNPRTGSRETVARGRESTVSSTVPLSRAFQCEV